MNGNGHSGQAGPGADQIEIVVTEPLDLAGVRKLGPVVDAAVARRPARLVVDMSACPHVDAAGIGLLLDTHRRMWRLGGALTLRSPSARIRRLLQVSRVDQVFHVVTEPVPDTTSDTSGGRPDPAGEPLTDAPTLAPAPPLRARATAPVRVR